MEAKDLRIGNWVEDQGYQTTVFQLSEWRVNNNSILNRFKPIPLSKEWLESFGFVKDQNYGYYISPHKDSYSDSCFTRLCFYLDKKDFIVNSNDYDGWYVHCDYVHQLQNLYFALTGEELELIS